MKITLEEYYKETISLLQKGQIDKVSERIDKVTCAKNEDPKWIVAFASLNLDLAEYYKTDSSKLDNSNLLITKVLQVYKRYEAVIPNPLVFKINKARAFGLRYDINHKKYLLKTNNLGIKGYSKIETLYSIDDFLTDAIKLYREVIQEIENSQSKKNDLYDCRNNLAQQLSRTGRYIEALGLFEINSKMLPQRWESLASYGDILHSFAKLSLLPSTVSLHLNICEAYVKAIRNNPNHHVIPTIEHHVSQNESILKSYGYELTQDIVQQNRREELEQFSSLNEFRKFVLNNSLSLNEHSIYCKCKDSAIDDLKIGHFSGSSHLHRDNAIELLDGYVDRILSEYGYARFLYFNHVSGISTSPNDIKFSTLTPNMDKLGYAIEQLRSSYRLIYSVFDKIMNGVFVLYGLKRKREDYFESFFSQRKSELKDKNNIHLAAIYSIALELGQGNGVFKHFKKIRNQMEHGFMPINDEEDNSISLKELEKFTFEILRLARSAIFSFVFLTRTETVFEVG